MSRPSRLDRIAAWMPLFILLYFAAQFVVRILITPTLGKDDAEQALLAQQLLWGYGPQPPLYTWLAIGLFSILGEGMVALALLKNAILAATYILTYAIARRISGDAVVAAAAALSLMLMPQVAWESQRALTHTVLVTFGTALFTYALVRILQDGDWRHYALLGIAFAIGVLAKFNFPIIAIATLLAVLTMGRFRPRVLDRRFLLTVAIAALALWRPLLWILENQDATMRSAKKMVVTQTGSSLTNYAVGLWDLFSGMITFMLPLLVVYGLLLFRTSLSAAGDAAERPFVILILRSIAIAFAVCAAMVFVFELTTIKERWMQPLLYGVPIAAALWCAHRYTRRRFAIVLGAASFCAFVVLIMVPIHTVVAPSFGRTNPLNVPYRDLADQIKAAGFEGGGIMAQSNPMGGNLILFFPGSTVITPEKSNFAMPKNVPYLLIWRVRQDPAMPGNVQEIYKRATGQAPPDIAPRYITADMLYSDTEKMRLGFVIVENP